MTIGIFYLSDYFSISIAAIPFLLLAINIPFEIIPASRAENSVVIRGADIFHRHGFTGDDLVFTNLIQIRLAYQYYYGIEVHTASLVYSDAENQSDASDQIKKLLKQTSPTAGFLCSKTNFILNLTADFYSSGFLRKNIFRFINRTIPI
jgi:hypothetical protein